MNENSQDYRIAYGVAIVLACAIALGVALFAIALVRALVLDSDLIVPAADQAEQQDAHPVRPGEFPPDLAWPFYPFRQSRADVARTRRNVAGNNSAVWRGRPGGSSVTPGAGGCCSLSRPSSSRS